MTFATSRARNSGPRGLATTSTICGRSISISLPVVDEQVVRRQVAVGQAVAGQQLQHRRQLVPQVDQLVARPAAARPAAAPPCRRRRPRYSISSSVPLRCTGYGTGRADRPQPRQRGELRHRPLLGDQVAPERRAVGHRAHLAAAAHPPALEVAGVAVEHPVLVASGSASRPARSRGRCPAPPAGSGVHRPPCRSSARPARCRPRPARSRPSPASGAGPARRRPRWSSGRRPAAAVGPRARSRAPRRGGRVRARSAGPRGSTPGRNSPLDGTGRRSGLLRFARSGPAGVECVFVVQNSHRSRAGALVGSPQ